MPRTRTSTATANPSAALKISMRPSEVAEYAQFMIENRFPLLVKGAPGIGKSDIIMEAAESVNADLIISHPVVSDPTDYKGLPFPNGDGTADFLPYGDLRAIITARKKTIFFIDDLGQASASVQAACMQLLLARRINGHQVSEHVTFLAATNRREDKAAVSGLLEPVKSRFASIIELEVNVNDWLQWALKNSMPTELIAFVQMEPDYLTAFAPTKDIINSPSPRTIANVGKQHMAGIPEKFELAAFVGAVGQEFAVKYHGFLKLYRELPSIDNIILDPAGCAVPRDLQVQYATVVGLAKRMTPQNIGPICTYLDRLPPEMSIACMKDAVTKNGQLSKTRTFIDWASKKSTVFI
jgi:hypothetical protein